MRTEISFLDRVEIGRPCPASLDAMAQVDGNRVRYCDRCRLNVHNLSAMTHTEAETLLRENPGKLCIAYFAREDGAVVTRGEPSAPYIQSVRRQLMSRRARLLMTFTVLLGCTLIRVPAVADSKRQAGHTAKSPATAPANLPLMTMGHRAYRAGRRVGTTHTVKPVHKPATKSEERPADNHKAANDRKPAKDQKAAANKLDGKYTQLVGTRF